jgi:MbtH protein
MNPFENEDGVFFVLKNSCGQFSLWPDHIEIPRGWDKYFGPAIKLECVKYIGANWTDMRPNTVRG